MALSSTGIIEVNGGSASASDALNAGYFNPSGAGAGTDFSLGAPLACSDLAIDATTPTKVSSASIGFTSAHQRNGLRITAGSGFTAGLYEIVSVSAGVATLDRAAGTAGSTGGTARVGGPLATPGMAASFVSVGGMTVFIRYWASAYNLSASANVSGGRLAPAQPPWIVGYDANRTAGNTDTNRPTLNCNAASMTGIALSLGTPVLSNLVLDNSGLNAAVSLGSFGSLSGILRRVVFRRSTATGLSLTGSGGIKVTDCEWDSSSGTAALSTSSARLLMERCYLHDVTANNAITLSSGDAVLADVVVGNYNGGGSCFSVTGSGQLFRLHHCTGHVKAGNAAAQQVFSIGSGHADLSWCLAAGSQNATSGYGFYNNVGAADCRLYACFAYSNLLGSSAGFTADQIESLTTLAADPFTNAAGGDFSLNANAGGGAAARGVPFAFPGASFSSYSDAGAVQHQDSAIAPVYVINQIVNRFVPDFEV